MMTPMYIHTFDSLFALFKEWCQKDNRNRSFSILLFYDDRSGELRENEDKTVYRFGSVDQLYRYFTREIEG